MQNFRRLRVWHHAEALAVATRELVHAFPRSGYSSLKGQIVTAAESIPFNIAEGCGAATQKEFGRYLDIGIKSACELESQFELAKDYGILRKDVWEGIAEKVIDIRKMLCGLRKKIDESPDE